MFTRTLLVLLVAGPFAFASEVKGTHRLVEAQSLSASERLAEELQELENKITSFFVKVGSTFTSLLNRLTGKESREKQAKLEALKIKYEALAKESEEALAVKNGELGTKVATAEKNLELTKAQADSELTEEINKWKVKFQQLKAEVDALTKSRK